MADTQSRIEITRTWRSEIVSLIVFFFMAIISIVLTQLFPWSIIHGELFRIGDTVFRMRLPLFWFLPVITIGCAMYRIYNVRYTITERGVEREIGILAFQRRLIRVWFEDIRSLQTHQSLLQRMLGVGNLEISTAATGTVEIVLNGIAVPEEVQQMLERERDKRQIPQHSQKNQHNRGTGGEYPPEDQSSSPSEADPKREAASL
ncbi:PH domain-containing protein [bacterium]|nr:PH domain-containing protein [bacterium]